MQLRSAWVKQGPFVALGSFSRLHCTDSQLLRSGASPRSVRAAPSDGRVAIPGRGAGFIAETVAS